MKAIIMAGGEGTRLRPLTCDCPKPMLHLLNKPMMEYAVMLLKRHGVNQIAATLGYLPDAITDHFGDGEAFGVQMRYYIETTPMGTAGSVKQAEKFLDERFIVLSGDGVTDIDLAPALRFHREKGALATLILKKSDRPREYGMVVTDAQGRILSFHEKPGRGDIYSDKINTGIYILEPEILRHIPEGTCYDFGHDLFPALVEKGFPVYGYTAEGYWCDVGDVAAYLQVHADALDGKIRLEGCGPRANGQTGLIESPVYISPEAQIDPEAIIGPYTVIGPLCRIEAGAGVKRSILLDGAQVCRGAQLRGCIVGRNAVIGEGAQLFEESTVGSCSCIGSRAILPPGVKLWPQKQLPEGERPEENIIWGACREQKCISGALYMETPSQAARAAQACAVQLEAREILLGRSASTVAASMWHAAAAGLMAQGVQIMDAGVCSLPVLRHSLSAMRCPAAVYIDENRLLPLNALGAQLEEKQQRSMLRRLEQQDFPRPFCNITLPVQCAGHGDLAYIADAASAFRADAKLAPAIGLCANGSLLQTAESALRRAGLQVYCADDRAQLRPQDGELCIILSDNGERAELIDPAGPFTEVERQLAIAWTALEAGETRLILPVHATRAIEALGAHAVYFPGETAAWMNALAQASPLQFRLQHDGLYFALRFLSLLGEKGFPTAQWRQRLPGAWRSTASVSLPERESGRILYSLSRSAGDAELGGGIRLRTKSGWVWLGPDENSARLNIIAEAGDMEVARELCDFYGKEIQRLRDQPAD